MNHVTTATLCVACTPAERLALLRAVREIAPAFLRDFWHMLDGWSVGVNDFAASASPIFLRLSEAFPQHDFVLTGTAEGSEEVWTRKYARGRAYVQTAADEWKPDKETPAPGGTAGAPDACAGPVPRPEQHATQRTSARATRSSRRRAGRGNTRHADPNLTNQRKERFHDC